MSNIGYKTPGGHMTSQDTQTNWCGITGKIRLHIYGREVIDNVRVFPDAKGRNVRVTGEMLSRGCDGIGCTVADSSGNPLTPEHDYKIRGGKFDFIYKLPCEPELWSDESPKLYTLMLTAGNDYYSCSFGFREFKAEGDKFTLNGRKIFLRGKHDGMVFPLTGFAPTEVSEWERVMGIAKSYGINHYRFHTCCPPEAAFEAADRLGIIMEPELPFWGTLRAPGEPGYNKEEQEYLISEGFRMLDCFGNHPSFCMMSLGNELWGSKELLSDILRRYKKYDSRRLYTQGSNNFQFFPCTLPEDDFFTGVRLGKDRLLRGSYAMCDAPLGHVQTDKPSTLHDYDSAIAPGAAMFQSETGGKVLIQYGTGVREVEASAAEAAFTPDIPIVTHEIGQYETFPDLREIRKYTGVLKARNFEAVRDRLEAKGLGALAGDFFLCSGKLAAQCYKEELEAAFRSRRLAGFQLLDLQDFPGQGTALVGMLDAFMDSKGLITEQSWRQFCGSAVILARFAGYCYEAGEEFTAKAELAYFREAPVTGAAVRWRLAGEGYFIAGEFTVGEGENYFDLGTVRARLPFSKKPSKITFSLSVEGTDIKNSYELTVFPKAAVPEPGELPVFPSVNAEAEALLRQGGTVLIVPESGENTVEGCYCTDFWCYPMFRSISESMGKPVPAGTMGLLIDNTHPLLAGFASERWTTPQWWDIVTSSRPEILDGNSDDKRVIVRVIDNFERCHDLALIYEYELLGGKAVICRFPLEKLTETPEGRAFMSSLREYITNRK